ncbi:MAG: GNAT family N-acetyltransferase [Candidatus Binatia bacterium]|nr:GNAT family N-acetyltransferase [Candidatus Binatia bacterium]
MNAPAPEIRIRRARWRDFQAVADLVAQCAAGELQAERRTIRRFRHIVHDLGNDLYLAFVEDVLAGLIHLVYVRELVAPRRAEICTILVSPIVEAGGIADSLLALACKRAQKRDCGLIVIRSSAAPPNLSPSLAAAGFRSAGEWYKAAVPPLHAGSAKQED